MTIDRTLLDAKPLEEVLRDAEDWLYARLASLPPCATAAQLGEVWDVVAEIRDYTWERFRMERPEEYARLLPGAGVCCASTPNGADDAWFAQHLRLAGQAQGFPGPGHGPG